MFALYLDIQKQKVLDDLSEEEVKGRWKSFVASSRDGRCGGQHDARSSSVTTKLTFVRNRGELAEGWYDPATQQKALEAPIPAPEDSSTRRQRDSPDYGPAASRQPQGDNSDNDDDDDDDDYGPDLPGQQVTSRRPGPAIPTTQDLEFRNELTHEDELARRDDIRHSRKLDRKAQKEALEELAPRADAGTRERQLEKKRQVADTMRSFRDAKSPGAAEVGEKDLLGDDGLDGYKLQKKEMERKKNERELRKEEMLRTRAAEREERVAEYRAKEDKTMEMLKALAKQRFG
ncbi:hypothetical protein LTR16_000376 [Cryomyces antarcticus]|uniref:RNA helicase n=1 Tax=Cryomyces antarcticus TaxID=329879 RepID=A0ABR0LQZ6_9PEZI|nr:hypothetical protein LTR39_000494 [Cryomyces antarcticus]KAK5202100.1 hypothetical protein LTR16_000376 [Cryomyces antarcticus]